MSLFSLNAGGEDWGLEEKMAAQQELLGVSLEAHPLELFVEKIAQSGAITTVEAVEKVGQRVTVAGVRQTSRRSRTSKGETMLFLTLEDLSGTLDVIVFPDAYRLAKPVVTSNHPMLITGILEFGKEQEKPFLKAEKIERVAR
jgi:DNA polymerase-3 subunit alpha